MFFTASTAFSVPFYGFNAHLLFTISSLTSASFMDSLAFILERHHLFSPRYYPYSVTPNFLSFERPFIFTMLLPGNVYTYPHLPTYLTFICIQLLSFV